MLSRSLWLPRPSSWIVAFMQRRVLVRAILIGLSFTTVSVALLSIPDAAIDYWYLYYSPILLAAFSFGLRGAALTSAAAALHVIVLQEWAQLVSARHSEVAQRLRAISNLPSRPIDSIEGLTGLPADEVARQLWGIAASPPDVALRSAQAGLGLLLVVGAALTLGWLVDQNRRKEDILIRLATTDALTGLWNRRAFQDRLSLEIERACRTKHSFGLLMLDLDHFKRLNDSYGHLAGDAGLRQVAERIQAAVRTVDLVARYGGEEFAVILVDVESSAVRQVADRVRHAIDSMQFQLREGVRASLSVSIGYAIFPADGSDPDALISRADAALYQAKANGRNQTVAAWDVPPPASASTPAAPELAAPLG